MTTQSIIKEIFQKIPNKFRTFGAGRTSEFNPIVNALKDQPLQFAAGVDVEEVIRFIIKEHNKINKSYESTNDTKHSR